MATERIQFQTSRQLDQLYASREANLKLAEQRLGVSIVTRDEWIQFDGPEEAVRKAVEFFEILNAARIQGIQIKMSDFVHILDATIDGDAVELRQVFEEPLVIQVRRKTIVPKTINQKRYLKFIEKNEIVFGIGPAGTGKTYLAMAVALRALVSGSVEKVILTRPAVEAGEALGFLPGDLQEKILPYLRPLYDAMYDMLGKEETLKIIEKGAVEIAPLAYMRGRTLSNAFVILDEAQNTTTEQMMMFLTRLGDNARMIITGDITQVDLPRSRKSGLRQAVEVLKEIPGIKLFYLDESDVVRHPLVQKIIEAYSRFHQDRDYSSPIPDRTSSHNPMIHS